jgi:hypothetical protein
MATDLEVMSLGAELGAVREGRMAFDFFQATPDRALRFLTSSAVNRNVGGSNPPRGANSLVMQRVANIFRKLCPLAMKCQVYESRLISINVDERKSTRAGVL